MFFYSKETGSQIRQHHTLHIHFIQLLRILRNMKKRKHEKQKNDRKEAVCFAACDLADELNFPPNTARSKVDRG